VSSTLWTYNLSVEKIQTYYVLAGSTPTPVHNSCGPELYGVGGKQFGKKWGKHSEDYSLNPGNPASRRWFEDRIHDVRSTHDEVRQGS
jgi:hypothetical protein